MISAAQTQLRTPRKNLPETYQNHPGSPPSAPTLLHQVTVFRVIFRQHSSQANFAVPNATRNALAHKSKTERANTQFQRVFRTNRMMTKKPKHA